MQGQLKQLICGEVPSTLKGQREEAEGTLFFEKKEMEEEEKGEDDHEEVEGKGARGRGRGGG